MASAKLIVIYPRPTDIESFERVYRNQHVPMAVEKLAGKTDFKWVRDHPSYVPDRPKRMRRTTYRRLRNRLVASRHGVSNDPPKPQIRVFTVGRPRFAG